MMNRQSENGASRLMSYHCISSPSSFINVSYTFVKFSICLFLTDRHISSESVSLFLENSLNLFTSFLHHSLTGTAA